MRGGSANDENESTEKPLPGVLQFASGEEFRQSLAVAELALRMWEANKTSNVKEIDKARAKDFLADAWELVQGAREYLLRPQGGSDEALGNEVERLRESYVSFKNLYDPERKRGDTELIEGLDVETGKTIEVKWRVYTTEKAFGHLFSAYWRDIREQHKREFSLHPERYEGRQIEVELADVRSQIKSREDALHGAPRADQRQLRNELDVLGQKRMVLEQRKRLVDLVNDDDYAEFSFLQALFDVFSKFIHTASPK